MHDMIWIGNTLLPRDLVYVTLGLGVIAIVSALVVLTEQYRP